MPHDPLDDILSDCLDRLRRGETVEACLARYPQHAAELAPLLSAAALAMTRPAPNPSRQAAARLRFQGAVRVHLARGPRPGSWLGRLPSWTQAWASVAAALVLVVGLGGGVAAASTDAAPESPLYPVKRVTERLWVTLTPSEAARARLHLRWAERRGAEIAAAAQAGRPELVERLQRDLVRAIEMANAEAGVSLHAAAAAAAPLPASAPGTAALRAETASEPSFGVSAQGAAEEEAPGTQVTRLAAPVRLNPELRSYALAARRGEAHNLARLTLAQRGAPPQLRQALTRVREDARTRYAAVPAADGDPADDPLYRVALMRGVADHHDGALWVGGRRIIVAPGAHVRGRVQAGQVLVVGGLIQDDGSILAFQVEAMPRIGTAQDYLVLQGVLISDTRAGLRIAGYPLDLRRPVTVEGGSLREAGHWVLVTGRLLPSGALLVERVRVLDGAPIPFNE